MGQAEADRAGTARVTVRPGAPDDAVAVGRCHGACWREAYGPLLAPGFFDGYPEGMGAERWRTVLGLPEVDVALALQEGAGGHEVVGLASTGPPPTEGEPDGSHAPPGRRLYALYLRAALHGSGTADLLVDRSVGGGPASLWVLEDNPRARAFYARHRFRPDGHRAVDSWTGLPEVRLVR